MCPKDWIRAKGISKQALRTMPVSHNPVLKESLFYLLRFLSFLRKWHRRGCRVCHFLEIPWHSLPPGVGGVLPVQELRSPHTARKDWDLRTPPVPSGMPVTVLERLDTALRERYRSKPGPVRSGKTVRNTVAGTRCKKESYKLLTLLIPCWFFGETVDSGQCGLGVATRFSASFLSGN